jgi:hypothetical protein
MDSIAIAVIVTGHRGNSRRIKIVPSICFGLQILPEGLTATIVLDAIDPPGEASGIKGCIGQIARVAALVTPIDRTLLCLSTSRITTSVAMRPRD